MIKTTVLGLAVAVFSSPIALAGEPKANVWQKFGDGALPLPDKGYPNLTGPSLLWLAERDMGIIAPILTEGEGRTAPGYRKFTPGEPKWTFAPGKAPKDLTPDMWDSSRSYVYLAEDQVAAHAVAQTGGVDGGMHLGDGTFFLGKVSHAVVLLKVPGNRHV